MSLAEHGRATALPLAVAVRSTLAKAQHLLVRTRPRLFLGNPQIAIVESLAVSGKNGAARRLVSRRNVFARLGVLRAVGPRSRESLRPVLERTVESGFGADAELLRVFPRLVILFVVVGAGAGNGPVVGRVLLQVHSLEMLLRQTKRESFGFGLSGEGGGEGVALGRGGVALVDSVLNVVVFPPVPHRSASLRRKLRLLVVVGGATMVRRNLLGLPWLWEPVCFLEGVEVLGDGGVQGRVRCEHFGVHLEGH